MSILISCAYQINYGPKSQKIIILLLIIFLYIQSPGSRHTGNRTEIESEYSFGRELPHCQLATSLYPVALSWAMLGSVFGQMGERDKAQEILQKLEDMSAEQPVGGVDRAFVYAGMGEFDLAFYWLEHAYLHREGMLAFFENIFNIFLGFEADPRLAALVKKVDSRKIKGK